MNYPLVTKQFQDVCLAVNPDQSQNRLLSAEELPMWENHRSSPEARNCLHRAYMIGNLIKQCDFGSFYYFKYKNLQKKYTTIANMYSNVFGIKYNEEEIKKHWSELTNYVMKNSLRFS